MNLKKLHRYDELNFAHNEFVQDGQVFFDRLLPDDKFDEAVLKIESMLVENIDTESLVNLHLKDNWFADFVSREEFVSVSSALLGVPNVKVFSSMILSKPAYGKMTVPWHQDAAYDWPLDPIDCASLWLAIDDVTQENGAMRVALKAHNLGAFRMHATSEINKNDKFFSTQLQKSIPEDVLKNYHIIDVVMKKGCSSFHHSMLPHASTPNNTELRRCAFIVRYCRGDAVLKKYSGMAREEYFKNFELFNPEKSNA